MGNNSVNQLYIKYGLMIKSERQFYEAPLTKVFEVKVEGIICQSPFGAGLNQMNEEDL